MAQDEHATGERRREIAEALARYPHVKLALPALGYGDKEVRDLEATIARAAEGGVEAVAIGTPIATTPASMSGARNPIYLRAPGCSRVRAIRSSSNAVSSARSVDARW